MIPKSSLDDRTFDDIVNEAIRLIPRYCPQWTNHNPSDPGIALIELFAWMTEMTLFRLNRVPEKVYLSLLDLLGLSLTPPQSAKTVIQFFPTEGYRKAITIKHGTQVAALADDSADIVFETDKTIAVSSNAVKSCVNRIGEKWSEYKNGDEPIQPFTLFDSVSGVDHNLYICSENFKYLKNEHVVSVLLDVPHEIVSVHDELVNFLYIEYWDGRSWKHIQSHRNIGSLRKKDNLIYLSGSCNIEPCEVNGIEGWYIRAVLTHIPENIKTLTISGLSLRTYLGGNGFMADDCLSFNTSVYNTPDTNTSFKLFSESPAYNEMFYIASDSALSEKGARVHITFTFSETFTADMVNENALFSYECWDGDNWTRIGSGPAMGESANEYSFSDGTFGFRQSGTVQFLVPDFITPCQVNGSEHYWLRIRILTKDFATGGVYKQDDTGTWKWVFSSKVHSPEIEKIRIIYDCGEQYAKNVKAYSNFAWTDFTSQLCISHDEEDERAGKPKEIQIFNVELNALPSLFIGFSSMFPHGETGLYIKIDDDRSVKIKQGRGSFFDTMKQPVKAKRLIDLSWSYWNGEQWKELSVNDYTDSFHESGFIEFTSPDDMARAKHFSKELYWIRMSQLSGSFEIQPVVENIILNAVTASHVKSHENEIAGSGTGAPNQSVRLAHGPLLPGMVLYVNEGSKPPENELEIMRNEGIASPYYTSGEEVWIRYREVENFYGSTPFSRHFVVDYENNLIHFGDGEKGVAPPRIKFNIKAERYNTGGGKSGNVTAGILRTLPQNIPFILGCDNPYQAGGGADMETVDNLKGRAAGVFKSLQRAVTAEDFQWLAYEASASVGRAWCLREKNAYGEIRIIIIPAMSNSVTLFEKLIPSRELLRRVHSYLDERKLVGTKIQVQGPVYRSFSINLTVIFRSDVLDAERLKQSITKNLKQYFHGLQGGEEETGWEFGHAVTRGIVLKQLEKITGIFSVEEAALLDIDAGVTTEKIILKNDEIPWLEDVIVDNRRETT